MLQVEDKYAFEKFPREAISFRISRREFWSMLAGNAAVLRDKGRGIPAYSLSNLSSWADDRLGFLIPMVVPGCAISVQDGFVWGQPPKATQLIQMFPEDTPALIVFNVFNGITRLVDAGHHLEEATDWDAERSFAYTRGLFLTLVQVGICQPKF